MNAAFRALFTNWWKCFMKQEKFSCNESAGDPQSSPYRWVMLAMLWLLYAFYGLVYRSISPLVTPLLADLDMSYSQMGFVLGSWQLTYIGVSTVAGFFIDRWGIRWSLFLGTLIIALSVGLRYFATGFVPFLAMVALFGVGGPMISIGCPKTIALWFQGRDRGTAVGIFSTGPFFGGALALIATNRAIMPLTDYSWRLTFALYGVMTLFVACLWWFLARDLKTSEASERSGMKDVLATLLKIRNIRIVLVCGLLTFAIIHGLTNWLPRILEDQGFSPTLAGYASSVPLLAGIPSLLILPRFIPPDRRGLGLAVLAVLSASSVWLVLCLTGLLMYVGLILYGIAACTLVPLLILILMETPEVGTKHMGSAGGLFFCVSEIGGFMGPFLLGALVDWTGGFLA
ncbi:MAG: major facilitator superfamily 1, partial [Deltaproteobacteria bacterium]|nr:major facilitator superfamily 1 [Deltaproteobacteria bacterium]